jgi:hypothetical protein
MQEDIVRAFAGLVLQHAEAIDDDIGAALFNELHQCDGIQARDRRFYRIRVEPVALCGGKPPSDRHDRMAAARKIGRNSIADQARRAENQNSP